MSVTSGKLSNYIGQAKDDKKLNGHFIAVDRDLQNLWRIVNKISQFIGINSDNLVTNTDIGFSYIPTMYNNPQSTPTNYTGHAAVVFCTSDSSLRIFNTSDTSWKLEVMT